MQAVDVLFVVDIIVCFLTAYYDENSVLVTNPRRIFNRYVTTDFLIHLVPAVPLSSIAWDSSDQVKAWMRLPKVWKQPFHTGFGYWYSGRPILRIGRS